jgi:Tfp pilus assembly protein PilX
MLKNNHLSAYFSANKHSNLDYSKQQGVIMLIALITLVAMTLAAIALVRSVDTTNIIAGNLAFQQSATNSGDIGSERAIQWLEANNVGTALRVDNLAQGYAATWDSSAGYDWNTLITTTNIIPVSAGTDVAGSGNNVSYIIQRMCAVQGVAADPTTPSTGCAVPKKLDPVNKSSGVISASQITQQYYRITTAVVGPRNTVSYIQTIVAM